MTAIAPDALVPMLQATAPENDQVFSPLFGTGEDATGAAEDAEVVSAELAGGVWGDLSSSVDSPWEGQLLVEQSGVAEVESSEMDVNQIVRLLVRDDVQNKHILALTHTAWSSTGEILRKLFQLFHIPPASKLWG